MEPDITWFTASRVGMFVHFGLYSSLGRHEWVRSFEKMSAEEYEAHVTYFDPDLFDADELVASALRFGAKYLVFTTKHHDGFALWDTKVSDFSSAKVCGRDIIRELVDAAAKTDLDVGFYHSVIDWHHPDFLVDCFHPDRERGIDELNAGRDMARYREYLHAQVRELLTGYGPIKALFYDFTYPDGRDGLPGKGSKDWDAEALMALTRELQPGIVVNNRLGIDGDYVTPEQVQPTEPITRDGQPVVWEACQTINGSWGYHRDNFDFKAPELVTRMIIESCAAGGNIIFNVGPDGRGAIPRTDQQLIATVGEWMWLHGRSIYGAGYSAFPVPKNCLLTQRGDRLYVHVLSWPMGHLHLPGLAGKVSYAQLLNDASELQLENLSGADASHDHMRPQGQSDDTVSIKLPIRRPDVLVPVIELFLTADPA